MSFMLTRTFAYLTLLAYLVVGSVAVRTLVNGPQRISLAVPELSILHELKLENTMVEDVLSVPEIAFQDITINETRTEKIPARQVLSAPIIALNVPKNPLEIIPVTASGELPFHEPVTLGPVKFNGPLMKNLLALYREVPVDSQAVMVAEAFNDNQTVQSDEVSSQLAQRTAEVKVDEAEPEFFDYSEDESAVPVEVANNESENNSDNVDTTNYSSINSLEQLRDARQAALAAPASAAEVVAVDDLMVFDYARAQRDVTTQQLPTVSMNPAPKPTVTTQSAPNPIKVDPPKVEEEEEDLEPKQLKQQRADSRMTIQVISTDLAQSEKLKHFELRFQDDLADIKEDFGTGEVVINHALANDKMTRSLAVLKRGYAPTNTDLILEQGDYGVSLPVIEERKFNSLMEEFASRGPIGAVLIKLNDETEDVTLDVAYGRPYQLNDELEQVEIGDNRYVLFAGVRAGNALLTYRTRSGESLSKIIHVHEHEVTYDENFYESLNHSAVKLFEEDLLAKEIAPLIISAEQVQVFATDKVSKKLDDHSYKLDAQSLLRGTRHYVELTHHEEPIFVGYRENNKVVVPSENFMRFVLSRFENSRLGNRCLVQINLTKKALRAEIGSESVAATLVTQSQALDSDGKFYDSIGEKTRKLIILGEAQGAPEMSQDGKINVKLTYQDGSEQFLSTYCSPNTYLVEQL
jgi:hypothetical protein